MSEASHSGCYGAMVFLNKHYRLADLDNSIRVIKKEITLALALEKPQKKKSNNHIIVFYMVILAILAFLSIKHTAIPNHAVIPAQAGTHL